MKFLKKTRENYSHRKQIKLISVCLGLEIRTGTDCKGVQGNYSGGWKHPKMDCDGGCAPV